jgi:tetratricopeptide (TPR) repeat protein
MKKFLLTAVFVLIGSFAFTQERIAIFPFEDRNNVYTKDELDSFYVEFSNEFVKKTDIRRFTVLTRHDLEKIINMEAKFQLSDYSSKEKTAEMFRVLNAQQILYGLIVKVGNNIRITVSWYTFPGLNVLPGGSTISITNKYQLFDKIPELVQSMQDAMGNINSNSSLEKGISYFNSGDYDRAIFELTDAIKMDPSLAIAYYYRSYSHYERNTSNTDRSQFIEDISQAIRLDPNNDYYYFIRAILGRSSSWSWDRSVADLSQAIRLKPNNDLYLTRRGYFYYEAGYGYSDKSYFDKAIADLSQAIRLDPNNAEAYHWRAWSYEQKGD